MFGSIVVRETLIPPMWGDEDTRKEHQAFLFPFKKSVMSKRSTDKRWLVQCFHDGIKRKWNGESKLRGDARFKGSCSTKRNMGVA